MLEQTNYQWVLDFMHVTLRYGKLFRTLNVVDEGTRDCLAVKDNAFLPAGRVVRVLKQLKADVNYLFSCVWIIAQS